MLHLSHSSLVTSHLITEVTILRAHDCFRGTEPVYTFGNASGNGESICLLHWKRFGPFTVVINEDCNISVALLRLWERPDDVDPDYIPRCVHFDGPNSPRQVFIPLGVLTGLTHFYPIHYILDDTQPVVLALDPVDRLLLAQMMTEVIEVTVKEDLPLPLGIDHHLPLLFFLGSHIVQLPLVNDKLPGVSFEILLSYRVHCLRKAAFGHKSVNVTEFIGAGFNHLLLRHLQRLHT